MARDALNLPFFCCLGMFRDEHLSRQDSFVLFGDLCKSKSHDDMQRFDKPNSHCGSVLYNIWGYEGL